MNKIITIPFTQPFIERLADHIYEEYVSKGKDLRRLGVVFGGRRPALFLKRALAKRVKGVFYPPKIFTIDELMNEITQAQNRQRLLDLDHCFVIYNLVQRHAPQILKGKEEFVHFLPWAREILNFIEHLDLEDTPADALKVLREHAAIGFNVPPDINRLLEALVVLRGEYHRYLDEHRLTSRGYQYLQAARTVSSVELAAFDHVLFCNFFYLHRTEMAVIKDLYGRGKATLLIQGDQRRWPALKRIAQNFGREILEGKEVTPTAFDLKVYAAFDMHAQAGLVSEILKNIPDPSNAVVVLPNADPMLPLLSAISPHLGEFNISLGYPLRRSSLYALLESIVQAHKTMKGALYYSRDYLRVLRHPLVKGLRLGLEPGAVRVLIHKLEEVLTGVTTSELSGRIFISVEDIIRDEVFFEQAAASLKAMDIPVEIRLLKKAMEDLHGYLFAQWQGLSTFADLAAVMQRFCVMMAEHSSMAQYPFNERVAARLGEITTEWAAAQFKSQSFAREDLLQIMQERLGRELVAFSGSPLRGLQILGLLETRSLSFDHVIVLDVNERILPNLNIYEPLIPREVMIKMNLDRLELEEEIQRYQFMRLISCAKNVHLIYQERPDKERSRFIEEMVWEQERKAGKTEAVEIVRPAFKVALKEFRREVPKTPQVLEHLKGMAFSATCVNTYLRNPYEFYQNYVLGLREKEDLLEDPESRHIGTFAHDLLEEAFKPLIGKKPAIDPAFRKRFARMFEERFHHTFGKGMRSDAFLIKAVLDNRLNRFLDLEAQRVEEDVEELLFIERKFDDVIPLSCGDMRFHYRVDRVDRLKDGTILIIDYKTGGTDARSIQMPLYLYYLDKQYPDKPVNAALYHLRTMSMEKFITSKTTMPRPELIKGFLSTLDLVMTEIFNPEIPFIDAPPDIE